MTRSERWILSEWQVALERSVRHGERLLLHRERTPFAEIDLLFEKPDRSLSLFEVKTVSLEIWGERSLIAPRQAERLTRAREWLANRYRQPVSLYLAVVSQECEIRYFQAGIDWLLT